MEKIQVKYFLYKIFKFLYLELNIKNERIVLMENIRQSCIYKLNEQNIETYWDYMIAFSDTCADLNNPLFDHECSEGVMSALGLDKNSIEKCMKNLISAPGKIEDDYKLIMQKKIFKVPEITMNGIKYRVN